MKMMANTTAAVHLDKSCFPNDLVIFETFFSIYHEKISLNPGHARRV